MTEVRPRQQKYIMHAHASTTYGKGDTFLDKIVQSNPTVTDLKGLNFFLLLVDFCYCQYIMGQESYFQYTVPF